MQVILIKVRIQRCLIEFAFCYHLMLNISYNNLARKQQSSLEKLIPFRPYFVRFIPRPLRCFSSSLPKTENGYYYTIF